MKLIKIIVITLVIMSVSVNIHAKKPITKKPINVKRTHTLQVEALGIALGYPLPALFYEFALPQISFRIGGAIQHDSYNGITMINTPLSVSYIGLKRASGTHALEVGAGIGILANVRSDDYDGYGDWYGFDGTNCDSRNHSCKPGTTDLKMTLHMVLGYRLQLPSFQFRLGFSPSIAADFWPFPHLSLGFTI